MCVCLCVLTQLIIPSCFNTEEEPRSEGPVCYIELSYNFELMHILAAPRNLGENSMFQYFFSES